MYVKTSNLDNDIYISFIAALFMGTVISEKHKSSSVLLMKN